MMNRKSMAFNSINMGGKRNYKTSQFLSYHFLIRNNNIPSVKVKAEIMAAPGLGARVNCTFSWIGLTALSWKNHTTCM